jgi:hypothetical protein
MKEPEWKSCTEEQLWRYVSSHLARNGIETVLVGGAAVSVYSEGAYRSGDLDLVLTSYLNKKLPTLMKELGFSISKSRHYSRPDCPLIIEFVSAPVSIGDDTAIEPAEVKVGQQRIKILSPTDCILDRLASYVHFKARECFDQAVLVANRQPHNLKRIREWCEREKAGECFTEFAEALRRAKGKD